MRRLTSRDRLNGSTDANLLERFFTGRDEEAFSDLVQRYGPMVMGVCLRLLHHRQNAEDAFQATFLLLARKGQTIRNRDSLSGWLYRVAFRLSMTQRARHGRNAMLSLSEDVPVADPHDAAWVELSKALDEEVQALPARYRAVMLLCCLQGRTYDEAARELRCPKGTVAIRLLRGREMLRKRLVKRGLIAAAACLTAQATLPHSLAIVPGALAAATAAAAIAVISGTALSGIVSLAVIIMLNTLSRQMWSEKLKGFLIVVLAAFGLTGTGASVAAQTGFIGGTSWPRYPARSFGSTTEGTPRQPGEIEFKGPGMTLRMRPATK